MNTAPPSPAAQPAIAPLRPAHQVMRLARLGALHQSRLSFMRQLTRRIAREGWHFARTAWQIDENGEGHACYQVDTGRRRYTLVAFAHDLPPDKRTDRVIAEAWDATFTLFDGVPTPDDIARLGANVPLQEAGRISARELTLARANRSTRIWDQAVDALARGQQPTVPQLQAVGYLMRTTAVYGSGKFGAADYATYCNRPEFSAPFQAEMLTVYLIRCFVRDLVNDAARRRAPTQAVPLGPAAARALGIGNSTGLGMAPYLVNHPQLLHNWIHAREVALARVRALPQAGAEARALFRTLLMASLTSAETWSTDHPGQAARIEGLRADLARTLNWIDQEDALGGARPWNRLILRAEQDLSHEAQEALASLMLEPYPALCDDLADGMADTGAGYRQVDGSVSAQATRAGLRQIYGDLLDLDFTDPKICARAWYTSAEKLEPRLGERHQEPIAPYELPLDTVRAAQTLDRALAKWPQTAPLSEVLLVDPGLRAAVRWVQLAQDCAYAEVRDNLLAHDMMPIDLLRAKLSFFGATRFDPRSDRWVRINMFQGAPYPEDLRPDTADLWVYPLSVDCPHA